MLGEKGKFKISVNIKNNESKTVLINGEERTLYLPLLTAAEFTLGNDNFTNVEVNSGKIINDGNNSLVNFVTIPGLKESLDLGDLLNDIVGNSSIDLSKEKLDFQEVITVFTFIEIANRHAGEGSAHDSEVWLNLLSRLEDIKNELI